MAKISPMKHFDLPLKIVMMKPWLPMPTYLTLRTTSPTLNKLTIPMMRIALLQMITRRKNNVKIREKRKVTKGDFEKEKFAVF